MANKTLREEFRVYGPKTHPTLHQGFSRMKKCPECRKMRSLGQYDEGQESCKRCVQLKR